MNTFRRLTCIVTSRLEWYELHVVRVHVSGCDTLSNETASDENFQTGLHEKASVKIALEPGEWKSYWRPHDDCDKGGIVPVN